MVVNDSFIPAALGFDVDTRHRQIAASVTRQRARKTVGRICIETATFPRFPVHETDIHLFKSLHGFILSFQIMLNLELVPHTPYCLDIVAALIAHLGAELFDVGVYRASIAEIIVIPYMIEDFFS